MGGMRDGGGSRFSDAGYANRKNTGYKPGPGPVGPTQDSRARNSRYNQSTIATRPATVGNIATALSTAIPGSGLVRGAIGLATGNFDPYSGPVGKTTGYSYDNADRTRRRVTALGEASGNRKTALGV